MWTEDKSENKSKDERMFGCEELGRLLVEGDMTIRNFREKIFNELIDGKETGASCIKSADQLRIRNPRHEDLGDVLIDKKRFNDMDMTLEMCCHMVGHKEFIVQDANHDTLRADCQAEDGAYHLLVREWNTETWEFGTLYEVVIKKTMRCDDLAEYLH